MDAGILIGIRKLRQIFQNIRNNNNIGTLISRIVLRQLYFSKIMFKEWRFESD